MIKLTKELEKVDFAITPKFELRVFDQLRQITHKQINEQTRVKLMKKTDMTGII